MKIEVIRITKGDIEIGSQSNCWLCPAALATNRHFFGTRSLFPNRTSIDNGIIHVSGVAVFIMPTELNAWIGKFDSHPNPTRMQPFTFFLWQLPQARADWKRPANHL